MKKIINPFNSVSNPCFACSDMHPFGLHLEFFEDDREVVCYWDPSPHFQGFPGILHGGIQATLMDEIASWTVFVKGKTAGVTSDIHVEYRKPVVLGRGKITLRSRVDATIENRMTLHTQLIDGRGNICSEGWVTYHLYPEHIARKKFKYPGIEAFFEPGP
jgi:uncharacterized protein (TIGR00369 family)